MQILCPTCNTKYKISSDKIPQGKKAAATCKKCGSRIIIEPSIGQDQICVSQAEPVSISTTPSPVAPTLSINDESGEFTFITEDNAFQGYAGFWKRFAAAMIDGVQFDDRRVHNRRFYWSHIRPCHRNVARLRHPGQCGRNCIGLAVLCYHGKFI